MILSDHCIVTNYFISNNEYMDTCHYVQNCGTTNRTVGCMGMAWLQILSLLRSHLSTGDKCRLEISGDTHGGLT